MGCGFDRIDADPIIPRADPLQREGTEGRLIAR
jgi:hypothetical protein